MPCAFYHIDEVGITQPTDNSNGTTAFPSCRGYTKMTKNNSIFTWVRAGLEKRALFNRINSVKDDDDNADDTTTSKFTTIDGWRVLRYTKRVGFGNRCYKLVQQAILDWDFEACHGNKFMGIVSALGAASNVATTVDSRGSADIMRSSLAKTRKHLLATFTGFHLPKLLLNKSIYIVNPVHLVYEVKDVRHKASSSPTTNNCLYSSTAYATLTGHLLAGEERVTVKIGNDSTSCKRVDVEILSFSRPVPSSKLSKCIWPLIGQMQNKFFLSEIYHLDKIAKQ